MRWRTTRWSEYQKADENGTGSIVSYANPRLATPAALGLLAIVDANLAAGPRSTSLWPGDAFRTRDVFRRQHHDLGNFRFADLEERARLCGPLGDQSSADYDAGAGDGRISVS